MKRTIFKKWIVTLLLTLLYFTITIHGMDDSLDIDVPTMNIIQKMRPTSIEDCGIETGTPKNSLSMSEKQIDLDKSSYHYDADVPTMNIIQKMDKTFSTFEYNHLNRPLTVIFTQNNDANLNKEEKKETQQNKSGLKCGWFKSCCCKNDPNKKEQITLKKNVDKTNFPPGIYVIIEPKAQSHMGISRYSGMGRLYVEEDIVTIAEVIEVKDENRIRGKLDTIPPEWISLYGFDDGYTWVQKLKLDDHQMEWFYKLDETIKKSLIELMSQAIQQYGCFNQNVELEMKKKFVLEDIQIQQLFAFMYQGTSVYDQDRIEIQDDKEEDDSGKIKC